MELNLFPWFLFAHILGAIIAFGPTFSSPIIGRMGGAEPAHGNFAMRISRELARVQILPIAIVQDFTSVALIVTGNIDLLKHNWLMVAIVLYLTAIGLSFVAPWAAQAIYVAVALMWLIPDRRIERQLKH